MNRVLNLLAAGAALCCTPALAQEGTRTNDDAADNTIVVTGEAGRPTGNEVLEQAREVSRVGRFQLHDEPLPRFQMPVCPGVFGIKAEAARRMVDRIRAGAERVGARLAKRGCLPNLIVDFADDSREFMTDLAQTHRKAFCIVPAEEQVELLEGDAPVRVWLHTRTIDIRQTGAPTRTHRCREDIPSRSGGPGGRLSVPMRKDIFLAVVVFDREAAVGLTFEQVADYATMRGLSHTRPAQGDEPLATILALFEDEPQPVDGLTSFDMGYLRSVYATPGDTSAAGRLLAASRRIREEQARAAR